MISDKHVSDEVLSSVSKTFMNINKLPKAAMKVEKGNTPIGNSKIWDKIQSVIIVKTV